MRGNRTQYSVIRNRNGKMFHQAAQERYAQEKKEMEHELAENEAGILKALNDNYQYLRTKRSHHQTIVTFKHPETKRMKRFKFDFEDNLVKLRPMWEDDTQ